VPDILTLAETKAFLNITSAASDAELALFITAASAMWERRVGPASASAYTETYDGGYPAIVLRHSPVLTVVSVVESYGSTVRYTLTDQPVDSATSTNAYGYTIDLATATLTRRATGMAVPFAGGKRNVTVQYTAGYAAVPEDLKHAVKLLVLHLWQTQRGGVANRASEEWRPDMAFTWPARVEEIAASFLIPGIA